MNDISAVFHDHRAALSLVFIVALFMAFARSGRGQTVKREAVRQFVQVSQDAEKLCRFDLTEKNMVACSHLTVLKTCLPRVDEP